MRIFLVIILSASLLFLMFEAYSFYQEKVTRSEKLNKLQAEVLSIEEENQNLENEIQYFFYEENLEKELRSKFNYRKPDEKMIIVVPQ